MRTGPNGSKSWAFRYMLDGRQHEMGLGGLITVSLATARIEAAAMRLGLLRLRKGHADGFDPLEAQAKARQDRAAGAASRVSFAEAVASFITAHGPGWRSAKHTAQWHQAMAKYPIPVWGNLPVDRITSGMVVKLLEPIWATKTETATRLRARLEMVFDHARAKNWRTGENPAVWKGNLQSAFPAKKRLVAVEHFEAMAAADIPVLFEQLRAMGSDPVALASQFVVLTCARRAEALEARWGEIDLTTRIWSIDGKRMKSGRGHRVPLSPEAIEVLELAATFRRTAGPEALLFPGFGRGGRMNGESPIRLLRKLGHDVALHGFRGSFSSWCASSGEDADLREESLAHAGARGDQTSRSYQHDDMLERRRPLMARWGRACTGTTGEVVAFARPA